MQSTLKVLGFDPGSYICGYGAISFQNQEPINTHYGTFELSSLQYLEEKLHKVSQFLDELFSYVKPHHFVLEKIFLGKNVKSAFQLGHVRGVCLQKAFEFKIQIYEYNPTKVKKTITGFGRASKQQVQTIVSHRLGLRDFKEKQDASDALALSLSHFYHLTGQMKLKEKIL